MQQVEDDVEIELETETRVEPRRVDDPKPQAVRRETPRCQAARGLGDRDSPQ